MLGYRFNFCNQTLNNIVLNTIKYNFISCSYNNSPGHSTVMKTHFFLVASSTCDTYLWSKVASPDPVITSVFQLWDDNTSIWRWCITSTLIPLAKVTSMVMANLGVVGTQKHRGMWSYCKTFMMNNKGHHPSFMSLCFVLLWFSLPCSQPVLACRYAYRCDYERIWPRLNKYRENKKEKKKIKIKNSKSIRKHVWNHYYAFMQLRYDCGLWINL